MMTNKPAAKDYEFQIVCISCGKKIRSDKHEDTTGECLQCFYRILSEKLLAQPRTFAGESVSER